MSDRLGHRPTAATGLVLLSGAMLLLAVAGSGVSAPLLAGSLVGAGAGLGLATPALQTAGLEALDARDAGVASGLLSTGRYLGGILAAGLVAASLDGQGQGDFRMLFALATGAVAIALALAIALPGRSRIRPTSVPEPAKSPLS
jgi:MFS family permease